MSPPATADIAIRELERIVKTVDTCASADLVRATALPGWTVEDLTRHLVGTVARQAEAFHRVRFGITQPPTEVKVGCSGDALAEALAAAAEHLAAGVRAIEETADVLVPLPFAVLPPALAAYVLLIEYGVHRYDVDLALEGTAMLAPDVGDAISDLIGLTLPPLAADLDPPMDAIRFEPTGRATTTIVWRDRVWQQATDGTDDGAGCVVRGLSDAIALFITGRIGADDQRLTVEDPAGGLGQFKQMFPGP